MTRATLTAAAVIAGAITATAATATTAAAQPSRPFQLDLTGGFRAGSNGFVGEGRLFIGYAHHVESSSRSSLFLAAGLEGTLGSIEFNDPRGVDNSLTAPRRSVGPSLRAGYAWSKHSWPQMYTFVSAAPIVVDTRTDSRMLPEAGRSFGTRMSLGFSFPGSFEAVMDDLGKGGCDGGGCTIGILLLLAPNTIEITYEQLYVDGEVVQRGGLGIGYAL